MLPVYLPILLVFIVVTQAAVSACPHGQYHDEKRQECVNCSICDDKKGMAVLRPCHVHKDVVCVPVEQLLEYMDPGARHWRRHRKKHRKLDEAKNKSASEEFKTTDSGVEQFVDAVTSTQMPFSSAETLVWDWQAIALTLAVFACILFFLVIALYSLHQARQWRRLKENFESDVEELSARLSLMAASSSEKGEVLEPSLGPIRDGNYINNRCVYLEQLLNVRKDKKMGTKGGGNVYIEESANAGTVTNGKT